MKARTIKNMMSLTTLVGACGLLLLCSEARAQSTCTVDRLTDTGEGQELRGDLRFCIEQARSGRADTIGFDVIGVITLTGTLSVPSVAIVGPGPRLLAVQQGASSGRI